jgi:hypothetical protein
LPNDSVRAAMGRLMSTGIGSLDRSLRHAFHGFRVATLILHKR